MLAGAALFSGFYLNELLMKLLGRHDPHEAMFDAYAETLSGLSAAGGEPSPAALRAFELRLLRETGVLPDLSAVTLTQQPVRPDGRYALAPEAGVGSARTGESALDGRTLIELKPRSSMAACRRCARPAKARRRPCEPCCAACFNIIWGMPACAPARCCKACRNSNVRTLPSRE